MAIYIFLGNIWTHSLGDEDHELFIDLETLTFFVVIRFTGDDDGERFGLADYLAKHPERLSLVRDALRQRLAD